MKNMNEISIHDTSTTYKDCLDIINDKKTLNHSELSIKWENFKNKFPQLYEMLVINNNVDIRLLEFMCEKADKQNKLTSREDRLETDFEVGEKLAGNFIYDKFQEPTSNQTEFIKNSIRTKIKNGETFHANNK